MSNSVWPQRWQPTRLCRPWDSPGKNTGVGCHFLLQCMKVKSESEVAQSCPTLRDPMDCSLPGSFIHGIFQARVLEWGAIAFSNTYIHIYMFNWSIVDLQCCVNFWCTAKSFSYTYTSSLCCVVGLHCSSMHQCIFLKLPFSVFPLAERNYWVNGIDRFYLLFIFLASPQGMQFPYSPTRDPTCSPCRGSALLTIGPPGSPYTSVFLIVDFYLFDLYRTQWISLVFTMKLQICLPACPFSSLLCL